MLAGLQLLVGLRRAAHLELALVELAFEARAGDRRGELELRRGARSTCLRLLGDLGLGSTGSRFRRTPTDWRPTATRRLDQAASSAGSRSGVVAVALSSERAAGRVGLGGRDPGCAPGSGAVADLPVAAAVGGRLAEEGGELAGRRRSPCGRRGSSAPGWAVPLAPVFARRGDRRRFDRAVWGRLHRGRPWVRPMNAAAVAAAVIAADLVLAGFDRRRSRSPCRGLPKIAFSSPAGCRRSGCR